MFVKASQHVTYSVNTSRPEFVHVSNLKQPRHAFVANFFITSKAVYNDVFCMQRSRLKFWSWEYIFKSLRFQIHKNEAKKSVRTSLFISFHLSKLS